MARSYKKVPGWSDNDSRKKLKKRQAARAVRHSQIVQDGRFFAKLYNPWDICDHNCRFHTKQALDDFIAGQQWYDRHQVIAK